MQFGRNICGNLETATSQAWLVTNGIGGYASGTISGILSQRDRGLLIANLTSNLEGTLLLAKVDETATYNNCTYPLFANCWGDESISPHGYVHIESFYLDKTIPVWQFACADALLEKRVWMQQGANTTYIYYRFLRGSQPLLLNLKAFVNYRNSRHLTISRNWKFSLQSVPRGIVVSAYPEATPLYLLSDRGNTFLVNNWYYNFNLVAEPDSCEDHLHASTLELVLNPGDSFTYVASTQANPSLDGQAALELRQAQEEKIMAFWTRNRGARSGKQTPAEIEQLVWAANSFIIDRSSPEVPMGKAIVAEYPNLSERSRDTTIALPGVTLATGKVDVARLILQTYAAHIDRGMLPDRCPDAGEVMEYTTVDSPLWYIEAVRSYYQATEDEKLLQELFPILTEIIDWYCRGTRHNIHLDATDGLLYAGTEGLALTWMNAKVGDWVVTPRIGKPIEVNALWYNALRAMAQFARYLNYPYQEYEAIADRVVARFSRFWDENCGYCYDVIDTPAGNDFSLRPNQIFAVSLPESPLTPQQQKSVVTTCARHLLTSYGLRSLSPEDPNYQKQYTGDVWQRANASHQGTVWSYLLGPFVLAHLRVYRNPQQSRQFLLPMLQNLSDRSLGTLGTVFDGDPPFASRGYIAQSQSTAEFLRAWALTE
jgi:predicted glycogen debranching enzyme